MLLQLRPIAGIVAVAVTLSMLLAGTPVSSWRPAAPAVGIVAFVLWTALFYWLRTSTNVGRGVYLLCGLILGILPWAFFYLGAVLLGEPAPSITMLGVGVVVGCVAGLALRNLSPFDRSHS
jgi:hypothetical protein